jgi:hypothetical protein
MEVTIDPASEVTGGIKFFDSGDFGRALEANNTIAFTLKGAPYKEAPVWCEKALQLDPKNAF